MQTNSWPESVQKDCQKPDLTFLKNELCLLKLPKPLGAFHWARQLHKGNTHSSHFPFCLVQKGLLTSLLSCRCHSIYQRPTKASSSTVLQDNDTDEVECWLLLFKCDQYLHLFDTSTTNLNTHHIIIQISFVNGGKELY